MTAFKGGVHPPEFKEYSHKKAIIELDPPKSIVIPVQQHLGAPCKAVVKAREEICVGQLVGEAQGRISAPIHASLSGKVSKVEPAPHPSGSNVTALLVDVDEEQPETPWQERRETPQDAEGILQAIADAGIVGMGGAGFPTAVKLMPPPGKTIDTLVINGCECEPFLTADHRLMAEMPERISAGVGYLMTALRVKTCVVALEDNKSDAAEALKKVSWPQGCVVEVLPTNYPQGAEKMLIKATLDRKVPSGGLPLDVGVVVQNVATAAAVADAVEYGMPLIRRVVTVTGPAVKNPGNYLVHLGTKVGDLLDAAGGLTDDAGAVVFGGPMMGMTQAAMDAPIIKTTSGIVAFTDRQAVSERMMNCIRCGRCVEVCPMGLAPVRLSQAAQKDRLDVLETYHVLDCIECGSCSYTCPSHRPLVPMIRLGKGAVTAAHQSAA
jgi:Na+-translocating ferredoxin:NAD+ oxidoreductase subunit C